MNLSEDRKPRSRFGRGRLRPALESLEGRRLMAGSLVATTLDMQGHAVDFAIQAGGAVVANMERPTNNFATPYQYSGYQSLAGLSATSIAAVTLPDGDPAVVASTGPQSYLYLNTYVATGNATTPHVWTGWQQFGSFVATSVSAVSNGTTGSAIVAIGTDTDVYIAPYDPTTTATMAATAWSGFQKLPEYTAASISVVPDGAGTYEVNALGGPQTYIDGNRVVVTSGVAAPTAWSQLGTFVATSINLTPGITETALGASVPSTLNLFAVGTDGNLYDDLLTLNTDTGTRVTSTYTSYGAPYGAHVVASTAIVSDGYLTIAALTGSPASISENEIVETGLTGKPHYSTGWYSLSSYTGFPQANYLPTALVSTPTTGGAGVLLISDASGNVDSNNLAGGPALNFPGYTLNSTGFTGFSIVASQANHPIATDLGPNSLPIVAALTSNGSVYVNMDTMAGTSGATDTYSGFTPLAGLSATSIAATRETNGFAVFALIGSQSYVYENQYLPTGVPASPYAWTGWVQMGTFVATSISAASPTNATAAAQATVFALGTNGTLSATGVTDAGGDASLATFTPLTGLNATSFSVKAEGSQILVAALTGLESYGYANTYTPATTADTAGSATGWTVTGKFVLFNVAASVDTSGNPVLGGVTGFAPGLNDYVDQAASLSLDGSTAPVNTPSNYQQVNYSANQNIVGSVLSFVALTLPGSSNVAYLSNVENYQYVNNSLQYQSVIYLKPVLASNIGGTSNTPVNGFMLAIANLGASTGNFNVFYGSGTDGTIYVSQVTTSTDPANPLTASAYTSLGILPS